MTRMKCLMILLACLLPGLCVAKSLEQDPDEGGIGGTGVKESIPEDLYEPPEIVDIPVDLVPEVPEIDVQDVTDGLPDVGLEVDTPEGPEVAD